MASPYPWQHALWQRFSALAVQQTLPQAILLTGKAGTGKCAFAHACAKQLLATDAKNQVLYDSEAGHPDNITLQPEGKMALIKVDAVRALVNFTQQTALLGGYRVIVIEQAESMNIAAANALLKTLEEPGAQTLFLLTSAYPDRLLPTIRSRCQVWAMTCQFAEAKPWLAQQQLPFTPEQAWALTGGAPLLIDNLPVLEEKQRFLSACDQITSPLQLAAQVKDTELHTVLNWLIQWVSTRIQHQPEQKWFALLERYYQAQVHLHQKVSVNAQLFVEDLLISLHQACKQ